MSRLNWRAAGRQDLADLLAASEQVAASAVGGATVYRLERDGRELLVVALPGNDAIVVEQAPHPGRRRRQTDPAA